MRVLVVDDSEDWRDLTEAALMAAGYDQVSTADSASAAYAQLGLAQAARGELAVVDLVVLDVVMPEIDGIEACARIRNDARYADVPVIMVTAVNDMESLSNAFVAGATDYITKPFNRVELLARVRSALKLKAELDRRRAREAELIALSRSTWGARDAARWIDEATGLFVGPAAEAYLAAAAGPDTDSLASVFAVGIDRLDALTAAHGVEVRRSVPARVAQAVSLTAAPIGVVAAVYPDGTIVLAAPRLSARTARSLGQALNAAVLSLGIGNPEGIVSDRVTVSIGVVTAYRGITELVADARHLLKTAIATGNRVAAVDLSSN